MKKIFLLQIVMAGFLFMANGSGMGCGGSSGSNPPPEPSEPPVPPPPPPPPPEPELTFLQVDFSGAEAFLILNEDPDAPALVKTLPPPPAEETSSITNLRVINAEGEVTVPFSVVSTTSPEAKGVQVTGTLPNVARTLFAPDGSIYLVFDSLLQMVPGGNCALVRVVKGNEFSCVDHALIDVIWPADNLMGRYRHPGIQFDGAGNIYYFGSIQSADGVFVEMLRMKTTEGEIKDLLPGGVGLTDFVVNADGFLYMSGRDANKEDFFRRLSPAGSLFNLLVNEEPNYFEIFPDGEIYASSALAALTDHRGYNLWQIVPNELEGQITYYSVAPYPTLESMSIYGVDHLAKTINQNIYISSFELIQEDKIYRVYPDFEVIDTDLAAISIIKNYFNNLLVTGIQGTTVNKLLLMQIDGGREIVDLLPDQNIEVYHVGADGTGLIYIDGLNYDTNRFIIGSIDTTRGNKFTELSETQKKIKDFVFKN